MPSQYVGISDDSGDKLLVNSNGTISTIPGVDPSLSGIYIFGVADLPGVVAANNFVSLFNPLGSGKTLVFVYASVHSYTAGTAVATASLQLRRITAASGGVDASASIVKNNSSFPASAAVVRTGNPTVTAVAGILNTVSPPLSAGSFTSGDEVSVSAAAAGSGLALAPGEGVVYQTASGAVDQRWNIAFGWAEI